MYEPGTSQTRSGNDVLWSMKLYLNVARFRVKEMEKEQGEGKEWNRIINGMKNFLKKGEKNINVRKR